MMYLWWNNGCRNYVKVFDKHFYLSCMKFIHLDTDSCRITISYKHTSRRAAKFIEEEGVNWWHTPPEGPYMNLTETLCHEMKSVVK